jgi:hypothetical protein
MNREVVPVACPECGEYQNMLPGRFDPDATPFGPVICMVCRRPFSKVEYLTGLNQRIDELNALDGPRPA